MKHAFVVTEVNYNLPHRSFTENLKSFSHTINKCQILIGIAGLLLGTLVYLVDRPPNQTYFVYISPINISLHNAIPNIFGLVGNTIPAFIHIFSFHF